ncbi:MAG: cytochrome b/b6 domain-containing protein, partial [Microbacterium sp.]
MAAAGSVRRGLPRVHGGEPWPPASAGAPVPAPVETLRSDEPRSVPVGHVAPAVADNAAPAETAAVPGTGGPAADRDGARATAVILRRGLPRRAGGEPWPPETRTAAVSDSPLDARDASAAEAPVTAGEPARPAPDAGVAASEAAATGGGQTPSGTGAVLRRGLPRRVGGDPWPPETRAAVSERHADVRAAVQPTAEPAADDTSRAAPSRETPVLAPR